MKSIVIGSAITLNGRGILFLGTGTSTVCHFLVRKYGATYLSDDKITIDTNTRLMSFFNQGGRGYYRHINEKVEVFLDSAKISQIMYLHSQSTFLERKNKCLTEIEISEHIYYDGGKQILDWLFSEFPVFEIAYKSSVDEKINEVVKVLSLKQSLS